eukprot:CAMPEP_0203670632 /NCGR_PEP_ID=MMETSP0090-20130426/6649_1 /ASSEMBLY_ACC=CAM_ASM_001088 /TAXON_ID=426623 /ORGANISM="Chaetoceros affinis, Strain CCMP159" /LENGTH=818 /DNA_ID=CAMNT_0050535535 /DNA_START=432 /DNA_END=2885 /DNA_ORIENTATION=-
MSTEQQDQTTTAKSSSPSSSPSSPSSWPGPKDAQENAKKQNKSISILNYWDIYAPPPSESTKGKIGSALPFLRDWRTHIDFGRYRRISLECHVSLKKSRGSRGRNYKKHFLRISKNSNSNDENGYKTKYLMDVTKFQIMEDVVGVDIHSGGGAAAGSAAAAGSGSGGSGGSPKSPSGDNTSVSSTGSSSQTSTATNNPKEVKYTTFQNGEHHEGSFIFDNYDIKDVQEFQRLMKKVAIIDNGGPAPLSPKRKTTTTSSSSTPLSSLSSTAGAVTNDRKKTSNSSSHGRKDYSKGRNNTTAADSNNNNNNDDDDEPFLLGSAPTSMSTSTSTSTLNSARSKRSTIGSLVERRDEEIEKLQFAMRDTEKHSNGEFSTILSDSEEDDDDDDDDNNDNDISGGKVGKEEKNTDGGKNDAIAKTNKTTRSSSNNTSTNIFLPETQQPPIISTGESSSGAASSPHRPKRTPRQPRKKRPYKAGGVKISSLPSSSKRERDRTRVPGGGLLQPVPPLDSEVTSSNSGHGNSNINDNGNGNDNININNPPTTKKITKVPGGGLLQPIPPLKSNSNGNAKAATSKSTKKTSKYVVKGKINPRSSGSSRTRSPSTSTSIDTPSTNSSITSSAVASDIEMGHGPSSMSIATRTTSTTSTNTMTTSRDTTPRSSGAGNRRTTSSGSSNSNSCCTKTCHLSAKILVNAFQTVSIIKGIAILLYAVALFTYQPDPLISLAVTLLSWSLLILIGNFSGMLGVNECRCCGTSTRASASLISIGIGLASLTFVSYCGLVIVFVIKVKDVFDYLDENYRKLFLTQNDIDFVHAHAPW